MAGQPYAAKQVIVPAGRRCRTAPQKPQATAALIRRRCQRAAAVCGGLRVQQQQHQQQQVSQQQWRALTDVQWAGSEQDAMRPGSPMAEQLPLWRLLLLSDGKQLLHLVCSWHGAVEWTPAAHTLLSNRTNTFFGHAGSVTRHLQLLTGSAVRVDCLAMEPVPAGTAGLPPVVHEMLAAPLLQREVRESSQGREAVHTGCCFILLLPSCYSRVDFSHLRANTVPLDQHPCVWCRQSRCCCEIRMPRAGHWCTPHRGGMQLRLAATCGTPANRSGSASHRPTRSCTVRFGPCSSAAQRCSRNTLVRATSLWYQALKAGSGSGTVSSALWAAAFHACRNWQTLSDAGTCGPFWGRLYLFWHGGQPLTVIHEVFSPHLAKYLLPAKGDDAT